MEDLADFWVDLNEMPINKVEQGFFILPESRGQSKEKVLREIGIARDLFEKYQREELGAKQLFERMMEIASNENLSYDQILFTFSELTNPTGEL